MHYFTRSEITETVKSRGLLHHHHILHTDFQLLSFMYFIVFSVCVIFSSLEPLRLKIYSYCWVKFPFLLSISTCTVYILRICIYTYVSMSSITDVLCVIPISPSFHSARLDLFFNLPIFAQVATNQCAQAVSHTRTHTPYP